MEKTLALCTMTSPFVITGLGSAMHASIIITSDHAPPSAQSNTLRLP